MKINSFQWNRELTEHLIINYQKNEQLYNTKHEEYNNRIKRAESIDKICEKLKIKAPKITVKDIRKKIHVLRCQFMNDVRLEIAFKNSHGYTGDLYKPKLWSYSQLTFLRPFCTLKKQSSNASNAIAKPNVKKLDDSDEDDNEEDYFPNVECKTEEDVPVMPQIDVSKLSDKKKAPAVAKTLPDKKNKYIEFLKRIVAQLKHLPSTARACAMADIELLISRRITENNQEKSYKVLDDEQFDDPLYSTNFVNVIDSPDNSFSKTSKRKVEHDSEPPRHYRRIECYSPVPQHHQQLSPSPSPPAVQAPRVSAQAPSSMEPVQQQQHQPSILHQEQNQRTQNRREDLCDQVLRKVNNRLDKKETDEFDLIGKHVALKLRKLPPDVKTMAEKFISDVLFHAEIGNINKMTSMDIKTSAHQSAHQYIINDHPRNIVTIGDIDKNELNL